MGRSLFEKAQETWNLKKKRGGIHHETKDDYLATFSPQEGGRIVKLIAR
jgi:hypothetical protein